VRFGRVVLVRVLRIRWPGSSAAALQVLGDIGGRCIQNLGRSLKILNETHHGKMTAEVCAAIFGK